MFKKLEVLGKDKFKGIKFESPSIKDVGVNVGLSPIGFLEVVDMSAIAPIVIMGLEGEEEFLGLFGLSDKLNIFNKQDFLAPMYVKSYPFVNIRAKNDKNEIVNVIGIDNNDKYVGKKKKTFIFDKKGELTTESTEKIGMVRELNRQRDISKLIIKELKANDLLVKRDFAVKINEEEKTVLKKFFVVNREKLFTLDEKKLIEWSKKGWITLIDAHLRSLSNFKTITTI